MQIPIPSKNLKISLAFLKKRFHKPTELFFAIRTLPVLADIQAAEKAG
jgi:hypothetical protein